jgi:phosphatidylinositol glycan class B
VLGIIQRTLRGSFKTPAIECCQAQPASTYARKEKRRWRWFGLCAAILIPRVFLAFHDQGVIWADEIFQTLEQGHRLAFGYGLVPWEFRDGARSWLLPGAIGVLMKMMATLGVGSGAGLAMIIKLIFAAIAAATFYPMLRMAHAWGGTIAALLLACMACFFPASLIYSSRAMAEVASALFLGWGLWRLWSWGMGRPGRAIAYGIQPGIGQRREGVMSLLGTGILLGLATLLRYQNGILLPAVAIIIATRRSVRAAVLVTLGVIFMLLLGGLLDWATWGKPFHSLIVYLRFNLIDSGANQWGVSKRDFFLKVMFATSGPALLMLVLGFFAGLRRTWPMALLVLLFLGVHSLIPHKELRFLFPALPLFLVCAAVGLAAIIGRLPWAQAPKRTTAGVLAVALLALFAAQARHVTFVDIGQPMDPPALGGPTSNLVWGAFDERNRLFARAGKNADLCGLAAPAMNAYWTGGYAYLHRRVPILWYGGRLEFEAANFALLSPGRKMDDTRFRMIAQAGNYTLYRREGGCTPPPRASASFGRLLPVGVPGL